MRVRSLFLLALSTAACSGPDREFAGGTSGGATAGGGTGAGAGVGGAGGSPGSSGAANGGTDAGGSSGSGGATSPVSCDAPTSACGDTCADLSSSPEHCGTCSHTCLGGECIAGECQATVLLANVGGPLVGVVDGYVYYLHSTGMTRDFYRYKTDKSGTREVIVSGVILSDVDVTSTSAFWTEAYFDDVEQCVFPKCPTPEVLSMDEGADGVTFHDASSTLFWSATPNDSPSAGALYFLPIPKGSATKTTIVAHPTALAHDETYVYWADAQIGSTTPRVNRVTPRSTTVTPLLTFASGTISALASDGDQLFLAGSFDAGSGTSTAIYTIPLPGGASAPTLFGESTSEVAHLLVTTEHVYAATYDGVSRCKKTGCDASRSSLSDGFSPGLAQDDAAVYFISNNRLLRIAK